MARVKTVAPAASAMRLPMKSRVTVDLNMVGGPFLMCVLLT
jgi:hypothetical protein